MVEKGVNERVRLTQIYEKKTEELKKQHEEIVQNFIDLKNKVSQQTIRTLHYCIPASFPLRGPFHDIYLYFSWGGGKSLLQAKSELVQEYETKLQNVEFGIGQSTVARTEFKE